MQRYDNAVSSLEPTILGTVDPGYSFFTDKMQSVRLSDALLVAGGYMAACTILYLIQFERFVKARAERERRVGSTEGSGYRLGGAAAPELHAQHKLRHVDTIFSLAQLSACSYLSLFAGFTTREFAPGWLCISSVHREATSSALATMLHAYYIFTALKYSKVLLAAAEGKDICMVQCARRIATFLVWWVHVRVACDVGDVCVVFALTVCIESLQHMCQLLMSYSRIVRHARDCFRISRPVVMGGHALLCLYGCAPLPGEDMAASMPMRLAVLRLLLALAVAGSHCFQIARPHTKLE
jgi:hypothetical protein